MFINYNKNNNSALRKTADRQGTVADRTLEVLSLSPGQVKGYGCGFEQATFALLKLGLPVYE